MTVKDGRPETPEEWRALSMLPMNRIDHETQQGSVYLVQVLQLLSVPSTLIRPAERQDLATMHGRYLLPSVGVGTSKAEVQWYRLPATLAEWVALIVTNIQMEPSLLPCRVEFGVLRGRHYAEML